MKSGHIPGASDAGIARWSATEGPEKANGDPGGHDVLRDRPRSARTLDKSSNRGLCVVGPRRRIGGFQPLATADPIDSSAEAFKHPCSPRPRFHGSPHAKR